MLIVAIIIIPCALLTVILGFLAFNGYIPGYEWLMGIPLVIGTGVFLIRRGIHEWWISRNPSRLSAKEINILAQHFPYYKRLGTEHQIEFEKRVGVFRDQKKFQMRGAEKIPGDIQLLLSSSAVQLTMGFPYKTEFFPSLATVVMFPRTFITPELSYQLHAVEVNKDRFDCMLIAVNMYVKGLKNPAEYYDSALYGYAKLFKLENNISDDDIPYDREKLAEALINLRKFSPKYIFQYTALKEYELFEMCSEMFFALPQILKEGIPEVYEYLVKVYQQDPLSFNSPGVQGDGGE
jgi:Mlc titration factor MtfA (ptsG expression regulator)